MPEILTTTSPLIALDNIGRLGVLTALKAVGFRLSPAMEAEAMRLTGSGV